MPTMFFFGFEFGLMLINLDSIYKMSKEFNFYSKFEHDTISISLSLFASIERNAAETTN